MTTANIKNDLIEKVKKMSNNDAKKIYGLMLEHTTNESLFISFDEIPDEHKLAITKGVRDLKNGKKQNANLYIKRLKNKYVSSKEA